MAASFIIYMGSLLIFPDDMGFNLHLCPHVLFIPVI